MSHHHCRLVGAAAALLTVLAASCGDADKGRVSLAFTFDPPPTQALSLRAAVEARVDPDQSGTVLASAGPVAWAPGETVALDLPGLTEGRDRVVVVEARVSTNPFDRVRYYGLSEPFDVVAGRAIEVPVRLALAKPAPDQTGTTVALRFDDTARARVTEAAIHDATIRVTSRGFSELVVANDASFAIAAERVPVDDGARLRCVDVPDPAAPDATLRQCDLDGWDLVAGLPDDLGDGVYTVFVQLVDARGYESAVHSASAALDSQAPLVLGDALFEVTPSDPRARIAQNAVWAGADTVVTVTFAVSERLAASPLVRADGPDGALVEADDIAVVQPDPEAPTLYVVTLARPVGGGTAQVVASLSDVAGNVTERVLGEIRWDVTAPDALDVARQAQIRLVRIPWGSEHTAGVPSTELQLCPGHAFCPDGATAAFEAGARIQVLATERAEGDARRCSGVLLATQTLPDTATAGLTIPLVTSLPAVCVTETDQALNTSAPAMVRDVAWVATLNGKFPGSVSENPHDLQALPTTATTLAQPRVGFFPVGVDDGARVARVDGDVLTARAERQWTARPVDLELPSLIADAATTWDPVSGLTWVFSGAKLLQISERLWIWDGYVWRGVTPAGGALPVGRQHAVLVPEPARGSLLVFGGIRGGGANALSDLWRFASGVWTQVEPLGVDRPPARYRHAMVGLSGNGEALLFGGTNPLLLALDDTWLWDGADWRRVAATGSRPAPRFDHGLAYDAARERVVLFGGCGKRTGLVPCATIRGDTWEWDGAAWTLVADEAAGPGPTARPHLIYDPAHARIVMYDDETHALWAWSGTSWQTLPAEGTPPPALEGAFVAFDAERGRLVVSGLIDTADETQTYEWDGQRWRHVTPRGIAPPRAGGVALAHDADSDVTWAFGGQDADDTLSDTLLAWNGHQWTQPAVSGARPSARRDALFVGTGGGRALLFGGCGDDQLNATVTCFAPLNDLWRWDGAAWEEIPPKAGDPWPEVRLSSRVAFDPDRSVLVMFGGCFPHETFGMCVGTFNNDVHPEDVWEWDGSGWSAHAPATGPLGRTGHAMAWDAANRRVVVDYGYGEVVGAFSTTFVTDTWGWDGASWTAMHGPDGFEMVDHVLVDDPARGRLISLGGSTAGGVPTTVSREFDGLTWRDMSPSAATPPNRTVLWHGVFDDAGAHATVLAGAPPQRQLWEWDASPERRPGILATLDWTATGVPTSALRALQIGALAGGRGATLSPSGAGAPTPGLSLSGWDAHRGVWRTLASAPHGDDAPDALSWSSADAADAGTLLQPGARALSLLLRPLASSGNGAEEASVSLDYLEVTARYAACPGVCGDRACGDDGCGGSCGSCDGATPHCDAGVCSATPAACVPDCPAGRCGDDGCGGRCAECGDHRVCLQGRCVAPLIQGCPLPDENTCPDNPFGTCRSECFGDTLLSCFDDGTAVYDDCAARGGSCNHNTVLGHDCGGCVGLAAPLCNGQTLVMECRDDFPIADYYECEGVCIDGACAGPSFNPTCLGHCGEKGSTGSCSCDQLCAEIGDCCPDVPDACGFSRN